MSCTLPEPGPPTGNTEPGEPSPIVVPRRRRPDRRDLEPMSDADYAVLLAAQGGGCAICGATPKTRRLHRDHDHRTKRLRGLLCHRCNRWLPSFATVRWLEDAAHYLQQAEARGDVVAAMRDAEGE